MPEHSAQHAFGATLLARWRNVWFAVAVLSATPTAFFANQALLQTQLELDTRLIIEQKLWESDPAYAGSPENWTRFAAWLLDHEQLLDRARAMRPEQGDAIEEEFHRHTLFAYAGVIAHFLVLWGAPLGLAYAAGLYLERRTARRSR